MRPEQVCTCMHVLTDRSTFQQPGDYCIPGQRNRWPLAVAQHAPVTPSLLPLLSSVLTQKLQGLLQLLAGAEQAPLPGIQL
jgi:hypothetical protein